MGKWESGKVGKWESGKVGKWENMGALISRWWWLTTELTSTETQPPPDARSPHVARGGQWPWT